MKYTCSITDPEEDFQEIHGEIFRFISTYGPSAAVIFSDTEVPVEDGLVIGGSYGTLSKVFPPEVLERLERVDGLDDFRNSLHWRAVVFPVGE